MLLSLKRVFLTGALLCGASAIAGGHSQCMKCHEADEFADFSADEIAAAVLDDSIPPHQKLDSLSEEQLQAIAAALVGS